MPRNFPKLGPPRLLRLLAASAALAWIFAAAWTLRLAWADLLFRRGGPESADRALKWAPSNAHYWMNRSDWASPGRQADLERTVALNPYASEAWIELGLLAESRGDLARAEQCLLQAARIDQTFRPRWSLANFYFRRHDERFWDWAHRALLVAHGDARALYRLCWLFEPDAERILARAIPKDPDQLARYLLFLLEENRLAAANRVAELMVARRAQAHRRLLVGLCERLLTAGEVEPALALWNSMCRQALLPFSPLVPRGAPVISNGEFRHEPLGAAFDWRLLPAEGVTSEVLPDPGRLRLRFSGRQPERCELVVQYFPAQPGLCYQFRYRYRTEGLIEESGLRWYVSESPTRRLIGAGPTRWEQGAGAGTFQFCAGPNARLLKLTLRYDRLPGTVPLAGHLYLESAEASALKPPPRTGS